MLFNYITILNIHNNKNEKDCHHPFYQLYKNDFKILAKLDKQKNLNNNYNNNKTDF